ncbi:MAG: hypothetical protein HFG68_07590 [Hungatella sp.]|nr:hypothetical protein [Hungatella sp.]
MSIYGYVHQGPINNNEFLDNLADFTRKTLTGTRIDTTIKKQFNELEELFCQP